MLGIEALNDVFFSLLISKSNGNQSSQESDKISSIGSEGKNSSQASTCVSDSDDPERDEENFAFNQAPFLTRKKIELENEIKEFSLVLEKMKLEKKQKFTTRQFWLKYQEKMPNRLALLLTNMPSSYREIFFNLRYNKKQAKRKHETRFIGNEITFEIKSKFSRLCKKLFKK
jgi:hypothetical protein